MIRVGPRDVPAAAAMKLATWQRELDAVSEYAERVALGKRQFSQRNRATNSIFKEVRATLDAMCQGARRCGYCEDSCADEVDHIRPKDLYPESVFEWVNYLYVCGPCNGPKGSKYAVFPNASAQSVVVSRGRDAPVEPPASGAPVFVNPRQDDPLRFIILDLEGTFLFQAFADEGTVAHERGRYTIDVLRLNSREALVRARRNAYSSYRARLDEYARLVDEGYDAGTLQSRVEELQRSPHLTVWREMQRQAAWIPALGRLFQRVPTALSW